MELIVIFYISSFTDIIGPTVKPLIYSFLGISQNCLLVVCESVQKFIVWQMMIK